MMDYIASHLEGSASPIISVRGNPNNILVGEDGIVLLIDREFPNEGLRDIYRKARSLRPKVAAVLYKDGETFFRNAAHGEEAGLKGVRYKSDRGLSLKGYNSEEVNRMITMRPEEKFLHRINLESNGNFGWVQYYQPASEGLEEGIESFRFAPVVYDYSHLQDEGFARGSEESKRLYIWDERQRAHNSGLLALNGKFLQARKKMAEQNITNTGESL